MTMNQLFLRSIVVGFFLCLTGPLAFGAANRTWVSGTGLSTNTTFNCSRIKPCDTFRHALSVTIPGGEIDVLDPGEFGTVTIAQSVSIVADGVVAGIQVTSSGGDGIDVTGSDVTVVLRGLTLDGVSTGNNGISFTGSGNLHIEDCTVTHFTNDGIDLEASSASAVFITDTIVRNNGAAGVFTSGASVTATLDNVRTERNETGVFATDGPTVSVRNSVASFNADGFDAKSSSNAPVVLNVESSLASDNGSGIIPEGAKATINISNVTVVNNTTGLSPTNGGHIVSFGNNKITDNTTNGSPTKTIAQH
jgi:hypothetical protein